MRWKMTRELHNVIYTLYLHRRLLFAENEIFNHCKNINIPELSYEYFKTLPLAPGMTHCRACFEAMWAYPVEKTMEMQDKELESMTFGY